MSCTISFFPSVLLLLYYDSDLGSRPSTIVVLPLVRIRWMFCIWYIWILELPLWMLALFRIQFILSDEYITIRRHACKESPLEIQIGKESNGPMLPSPQERECRLTVRSSHLRSRGQNQPKSTNVCGRWHRRFRPRLLAGTRGQIGFWLCLLWIWFRGQISIVVVSDGWDDR